MIGRPRTASEEEGEIGEEEGEIVVGGGGSTISPTNHPGNSNVPASSPSSSRQMINTNTRDFQSNQSLAPPPLKHQRASSMGGAIPSSQQQPPPPPKLPPPLPPPERRRSWGGHRGGGRGPGPGGPPPPPFQRGRGGGGLGHRHTSFSGHVPATPSASNQPQRSQSFSGFLQRPNAGGVGGPPHQHHPPPPVAAAPRATDPRFRAGGSAGGPAQPPMRPPASDGPASMALEMQQDNAPGGPPMAASSYSSLAESGRGAMEGPPHPHQQSQMIHRRNDSFSPPPGPPLVAESSSGSFGDRGGPLPPIRGPGDQPPDFAGSGGPNVDQTPSAAGPPFGGGPRGGPRDSFRGGHAGRRGSDFRGGGRGDGAEASYYGPTGVGGAVPEFRRSSPPPRPRPMFGGGGRGMGSGGPPPPNLAAGGPGARQTSFSSQGSGPFHRNKNDPRFSKVDGPDQVRSSFEAGAIDEGHGADRSFFRKPPPQGASESGADPFGRSREWTTGGSSRSPQVSPQTNRKTHVLTYFQSSPGERAGATAPLSADGQGPASPRDKLKDHPHSAVASSQEVEAPLVTAALVDPENIERAEKVITSLTDVMDNPSLMAAKSGQSELPNKQLIFRALAKINERLKQAQKELDDQQAKIIEAEKEEKADREREQEEAAVHAKRQEKERLEEERRKVKEQEDAHESALKSLFERKKADFETEVDQKSQDIEEQLRTVRIEEEKKQETEITEQIAVSAAGFDKDIAKSRRDLEKVLTQQKKTEGKVSVAEAAYQSNVERFEKSNRTKGPPKTEDIVADVLAANQRRAAEAHLVQFATVTDMDITDSRLLELAEVKDPSSGRTSADWAQMTQQVTGFSDALYNEPAEAPYYDNNEKMHEAIAVLVKEYISDRQRRLKRRWTELAEEYEYRKKEYAIMQRKRNAAKGGKKRSSSVAIRHSILDKPILESSGGRASTNPYRRARRGNEVRSEYEQEQIIAELAAKEAMEKKIAFGGSKLPRQVGLLEKALSANYVNTFVSQKVDLIAQEADLAISNTWSDVEKCIFLDRFMQHPKDFRKIASFLRNKTTRDCVCFYYDSKQYIPYKEALKEHIMRRKRRGDYHVWDATIEAALSVGAKIELGPNEDKPLLFLLPEHDQTFHTMALHPMRQELFDPMQVDEAAAKAYVDEDDDESRPGRSRKRSREPLFELEPEKKKFLRSPSPEPSVPMKVSASRSSLADTDITDGSAPDTAKDEPERMTPTRRAPQKWTSSEKKLFIDTLKKHGRNWAVLAEAVGTKSISQIKNFYYDYKKQSGKNRQEKEKKSSKSESSKARKRETAESSKAAARPTAPSPEPSAPAAEPVAEETPTDWVQQSQNLQRQQLEQQILQHRLSLADEQYLPTRAELEEALNRQRSESSASDLAAAERWVQLQHHLNQQHQSQTEEAARRLLHHQSHSQHQQLLSSLLPWVGSPATSHVASASTDDYSQISNAQQLQHLLQLHQSHQSQVGGLDASHLQSLGLSGLAGGLNAGALELALAQQHRQQQQHHHQSVHRQQQSQSDDRGQLTLAQQLLAFQGQGGHDANAQAEALALLQRAMGNGSFPGPGNRHGGGGQGY